MKMEGMDHKHGVILGSYACQSDRGESEDGGRKLHDEYTLGREGGEHWGNTTAMVSPF